MFLLLVWPLDVLIPLSEYYLKQSFYDSIQHENFEDALIIASTISS